MTDRRQFFTRAAAFVAAAVTLPRWADALTRTKRDEREIVYATGNSIDEFVRDYNALNPDSQITAIWTRGINATPRGARWSDYDMPLTWEPEEG